MKTILRKTCKIRDSIFKDTCELNFHGRSSYEYMKIKSLMPADTTLQVSSTDSMILHWELAVNKAAWSKDSDLLEL